MTTHKMIDLKIERRTLRVVKAAPPVVFLMASAVFAMWIFGAGQTATKIYKANTAAAFMLAAAAGFIFQNFSTKRSLRLARALSLGVLLIGVATTFEYVIGQSLGIDQIFANDDVGFDSLPYPGRMSPIASMVFVLLGFGLFGHGRTWDRERTASTAALFLIPVIVIGLFASVGYIYGLNSFYKIGPYIRVTASTSVTFFVMGMSMLFSAPRFYPARVLMSSGVGGMTARRLLPLFVALPITLSWFGLISERLGFLGEEFAVSLLGMILVLSLISVFLLVARNMDNLYFRELDFRAKEQRAREHLTQVLEATQLATFEWNPVTESLVWNNYHARLFGYQESPDSRSAEDFTRRVHPEDLEKVMSAAAAAIEARGEFDCDYRIILPDGSIRWLYCRGRHAIDNEGHSVMRGTVIDMTERKSAELKALESEARLNLALTSADIGFWNFAFETGETFLSETLMADWGIRPEEFHGNIESWLGRVHVEDRERMRQAIIDSIENNVPYNCEYRVVRPTGEIIWILGKGNQFYDQRAGAMRMAGVTINITERKRATEELEQAKDQAESASRLKSAFLANMSHEIRTPLGVMLGFTDLIIDPGVAEKDKVHFAETLKRNGEQLTLLINDILDLSKVEAGQLKIDAVPFSLKGLVNETLSALNIKAAEKGLRLKYAIENPLNDRVLSDPIRVKQILWNLIGNSIKFTPQGEIYLKVVHRRERLEFEIRDTGIGISPEQQAALFKPFSQADPSITRKFGGTGLGLALSRRLAELLGGDLTLSRSEMGRGSTFKLSVRDYAFSAADENELPVLNLALSAVNTNLESEECLRGLKILLVEDSPDNQDLIGRILTRRGASVETADNGHIGTEKALRGNFDVVLMDVQMPVLDGLSATTMLRTLGYGRPIIALTAHAMSEVRKQCLDAGCTDYLSKPVNARELMRKVLTVSARQRPRESVI